MQVNINLKLIKLVAETLILISQIIVVQQNLSIFMVDLILLLPID